MKILITGACGRMGKAVAEEIKTRKEFTLLGGVDKAEQAFDFPLFPSFDLVKETPDCIVDFSSSAVLSKELRFAREKGIGVVIGTTSLSEIDLSVIE